MNSLCKSSEEVISKLIEMGFDNSLVQEAIKEVGPSLTTAAEYILNDSFRSSSSYKCSTSNRKSLRKRAISSHPLGQMRQSSIVEHFQSTDRSKRSRSHIPNELVSRSKVLHDPMVGAKDIHFGVDGSCDTMSGSVPVDCELEMDIGSELEQKVSSILQKHFGFSYLKSFQKEALAAWLAHKDCLVLAATGSGKSLCFQITTLLTKKVVVVISPLISLMHDQCLKLAKHGISACFLGSGQPDNSVEKKAMNGIYDIIYVCPETILRLIKPLQRLAETHGIALFAIDEVHCVSKWGHDFRPDYRRLSVLRENFSASNLKFLKFDIPLMALTATATVRVREDIIESLHMSKEMMIVCTSFFRSNLRFSVKHSKTSSPSSYQKDFSELIDIYTRKTQNGQHKEVKFSQNLDKMSDDSSNCRNSISGGSDAGNISPRDLNCKKDCYFDENSDEVDSADNNDSKASSRKHMTVEYLEDEADDYQDVEDWDVSCGEFCGQYPVKDKDISGPSEMLDLPGQPEERSRFLPYSLESGVSIIYVPTRKETLSIAKYLCRFGVKAASYNAKLPKSHLRQVHKEFHENTLEVVVATIAFGMGIDKSNVRRIIHYGWPQSLEAYYQEAGRAGRDGKFADCTLYANLSRIPTLLPSKRSENQKNQAHKMLSDCFRYGMNTSCCRAKILVEYFGESFRDEKCLLCDVCVNGPPEVKNVKEEAGIFMQAISSYYGHSRFSRGPCSNQSSAYHLERPNIRMIVSKIREQSQKFVATDLLWWQGLARIMDNKGYIREGDEKTRVQIKFPEPTELGLVFLQSETDETFMVYPEADMLFPTQKCRPYSSFSEWGKGWADPEIRRQRLERRRVSRSPRKRKLRKTKLPLNTVRGRLASKLSKN